MKFFNLQKNKKLQYIIYFFIGITIIIILGLLFYFINKYFTNIEKFENKPDFDTVISNFDNGSGFYSELFFKLNHILYCKKYDLNFKINCDLWPYTSKNGWTDYFENIEFNSSEAKNSSKTKTIAGCCEVLEDFPIKDYINTIKTIYKYNDKVNEEIQNTINNLGLNNKEYGAIYIRRGDKLVNEIDLIESEKFIKLLLEKYPDCKTIFLQTDDYTCYTELEKYIKDNNLNIELLTLCKPNVFGAISTTNWKNQVQNSIKNNNEYLKKFENNLSKPINEMNSEERYDHTLELITSVEICKNSKILVCDLKSNVSRFIKIYHNNFDNVYDINGVIINIDDKKCPGFNF